jgi:hypothetical protein
MICLENPLLGWKKEAVSSTPFIPVWNCWDQDQKKLLGVSILGSAGRLFSEWSKIALFRRESNEISVHGVGG